AVLLRRSLAALLVRDRSREAWRASIGLLVAGALGGALSLAVFYGRYVPIFLDMQRGVPMAEERILLEKPPAPVEPEAKPEEPDDPYAGPSVDPMPRLPKAASPP